MPNEPTLRFEIEYWNEGIGLIAGVDEVGMGALAGPVTAAAVTWDQQFLISNFQFLNVTIRDSKTLSVNQRERADAWIREHASAWAVGEASVEEIEEINIRSASHLAMRRAVDALKSRPELLLVDGNSDQIHPLIPAVNIISGDSICYSIAAASIVAKVHRDNAMVKLGEQYPEYGFAAHKGYGSAAHMEALKTHGATLDHRRSYAPVAAVI